MLILSDLILVMLFHFYYYFICIMFLFSFSLYNLLYYLMYLIKIISASFS